MMAVVSFCGLRNINSAVLIPKLLQIHNDINKNNILIRKYSQDGSPSEYDMVVVGGGIIGMATARELKMRHPALKMAVLEKESKLAYHQSGNNSGVIHAGIYYTPGSLKAKLCVEGLQLAYKYFDEKKIPYKKVGKLIVATNSVENDRLEDLLERGKKNNVPDLKVVDAKGIKEIEPNCVGIRALWSPHTGIVDWAGVTQQFGKDFTEIGGKIHLNFKVTNFEENKAIKEKEGSLMIKGEKTNVLSKYAVVCAGLQSDQLAKLSGCSSEPRIIPFRGEFLMLDPSKANLIKGNIYPVPDPRYPFLGVHFTPRMDGNVLLGPNAVLAMKREGYSWTDIDVKEMIEVLTYPGFQKLAVKNIPYGASEMMKSIIPQLQVKELQKFIPQITYKDIKRGPSGVRAQAMDKEGKLVDDFVFDVGKKEGASGRVLHCRNCPSPGATSSLAIACMISDRVKEEFKL